MTNERPILRACAAGRKDAGVMMSFENDPVGDALLADSDDLRTCIAGHPVYYSRRRYES